MYGAITTRWHLLCRHPQYSRRARRRLHAALQAPTATPTTTITTVPPPGANRISMAAGAANPKLVAGDQGLHSTWSHRAWVAAGCASLLANNLHALGRVMALAVLPLDVLAADDAVLHAFAAVFGGCIMFSQQFHAWAHGTKSRLPPPVAALQDLGLLVSRREHAAHHRPPYNGNYCIVSGVWNGFLDEHRVFEAAEMVIFFRLGVRPRSWSEPELEWMEEEDDGSGTSLAAVAGEFGTIVRSDGSEELM